MKKAKIIILFIFFTFVFLLLTTDFTNATISDWEDELIIGAEKTNLYQVSDDATAVTTSEQIAKYIGGILAILPYLGVIFLIQVVIAGYQWMTAGGNMEKVETAKKRIIYAVIGIAIFAAMYLIAYFIIKTL